MIKDYKKVYIGSIIACIATLVITDHVAVPCIINTITGYYCPGCGITRAIVSFLKGQLYQAFRYNSIIFIDIPVIILLTILERKIGKDNKAIRCISNIILIILLILTIVYGVLRNIPSFSYMAPTNVY